jgi:hypothetical protein
LAAVNSIKSLATKIEQGHFCMAQFGCQKWNPLMIRAMIGLKAKVMIETKKESQHNTTQPPVEILHDDQDPTQNETNNEVIDEEVKLILKVVYMKASKTKLSLP